MACFLSNFNYAHENEGGESILAQPPQGEGMRDTSIKIGNRRICGFPSTLLALLYYKYVKLSISGAFLHIKYRYVVDNVRQMLYNNF